MSANSLKKPQPANDEELKPSLIPPVVAAILSAVIPGLGQILARAFRRGLLLFVSFLSIVGLILWRANDAASLGKQVFGWVNIFQKAFRLAPFLILVSLAIIVLYVWIIVDAYRAAKFRGTNPVGVFVILIIVFFVLGWQIGEINPIALFTQADDAVPALSKVLWPWEAAIDHPEELLIGEGIVLSPCDTEPFTPQLPDDDIAYIKTDPTCGDSTQDDDTPGTSFSLHGYGFMPGIEAEIWWQDPGGNEFRQRQEGEYTKVMPDENGEFKIDIIMPYRLLPSGVEGPKEWTIQARQLASIGEAEVSSELKLAVEKIIETIFIGMMATFFGIIFALPISFLAARNLMSGSPVTLAIYYITRGVLNLVRSIEPLIWAIIAVIVVGLGPFAGILALTLHSMAALGKLYSESIESIDPGPIEAIQATGANWLQVVMFAVVPQIIPPFVSFTIYRWDINIRMSTIIGFVGGGGIGFLLAQWIRILDYRSAGIAVWFIAIIVAILDFVSAEIRARYV
jgi:phosphonate transport system permease protein